MAVKIPLLEAVLKQPGEEMFILGERDHAVPHVTGRQHVEVFPKPSGGAAIVGYGDDGGEVRDGVGGILAVGCRRTECSRWGGDVVLEAAE